MIATIGDPLGRAEVGSWARTYVSNVAIRGDKNFLIGSGAWPRAARSFTAIGPPPASRFDYPNDLWDVALKYKRVGEAFDPSLGFVPRAGVHIADLNVNWQPRPEQPLGPLHVRQCFWENELSYVSGLTDGWQSYRYFMAPINCRLESGDRFEFNFVPTGERFSEPFEIADGVTIPGGAYHFKRFRLEAGLAPKRRLNAQATWWFGTFYDGYLNQYQLTGAWKPWSLFIVELTGERDVGLMPEGGSSRMCGNARSIQRLARSAADELRAVRRRVTHSFGTNTRLRWTFSPLGDLFVVYNHNLRYARSADVGTCARIRVEPASREGAVLPFATDVGRLRWRPLLALVAASLGCTGGPAIECGPSLAWSDLRRAVPSASLLRDRRQRPDQSNRSPILAAAVTASVRVDTSSLSNNSSRCVFTVFVEIPRRAAICLLPRPSAKSARTSRSRCVSTGALAVSRSNTPLTRDPPRVSRATTTSSASAATSATEAPASTTSNAGLARSAAANAARNSSDSATTATRVIPNR
jgi:hypothetical protein